MTQVGFERVSQQKQHDFDQKTCFGNGMNLLEKPHRNLAKRLPNPLTKLLFISGFSSLIGALTVALSAPANRLYF